ncbi:hypothetical protein ES708_19465 [subsurface metagenome]
MNARQSGQCWQDVHAVAYLAYGFIGRKGAAPADYGRNPDSSLEQGKFAAPVGSCIPPSPEGPILAGMSLVGKVHDDGLITKSLPIHHGQQLSNDLIARRYEGCIVPSGHWQVPVYIPPFFQGLQRVMRSIHGKIQEEGFFCMRLYIFFSFLHHHFRKKLPILENLFSVFPQVMPVRPPPSKRNGCNYRCIRPYGRKNNQIPGHWAWFPRSTPHATFRCVPLHIPLF